MTTEQTIVFAVLFFALILFVTERWRYDIVALSSLLAVAVSGVVPSSQLFSGFGHPAVVTVAAVLVLSRGLQNSGLIDRILKWMSGVGDRLTLQVAVLTGLVAVFSGFMNNVGALALFLPTAIRMARKSGNPPSLLLMPIAFASLLGGMTTLIGTPPNIIIGSYRAQTGQAPFRMFDFTAVGSGVAIAGLLYMSIIGWRLIPKRKGQASREELFRIEDYVTEVTVPGDSKMVGTRLRDIESTVEGDVTVVGLVRGQRRILVPSSFETLEAGDIVILEADAETLKSLVDAAELELGGGKELAGEILGSDEISLVEAVVRNESAIEGNTAWTLSLRWRYGLNLLGVARQGSRLKQRLSRIRFRAGDVLLLQGQTETIYETLSSLGCLPLAERELRLGQPRRIVLALAIMAVAIFVTATGLLPAHIAFLAAALVMGVVGLVTLREAYASINWPILILLGAMFPVGEALEKTGGAGLIADALLSLAHQMPPAATLATVLLGAMILTPLVNNATAAILLAPIAISLARGLEASPDPFLMAVCIGSSCDFLTPIGHQSNTLVLGPGGYKFSDYARMGLVLEIIILALAVPLILWFWPLKISL
jgi:di/tricarboxylate transporter